MIGRSGQKPLCRGRLLVAVAILALPLRAQEGARYVPQADSEVVPRQPYLRHSTTDALGRRIVFYLSEEPAGTPALPLVGYVQGSGAGSLFTHVGVLAGGGPSQLFDLVTLARRGTFFTRVSADPEERVRHVLESWQRIRAQPDRADELFLGHPYRRWSSFLATSTLEQLAAAKARVYAAHGENDAAVARESFDVLRTGLLARGRDATFDLVAGADHSFAVPGGDGWRDVLARVVDWFLGDAPKGESARRR